MSPKNLRKLTVAEVAARIKPEGGATGKPGTSFTAAKIVDGHLHITDSTGHTADLGQVIFEPKHGEHGSSVNAATIEGDHLYMGTTAGEKLDAGRVVFRAEDGRRGKQGERGVGILSGKVSPDGNLILKLSDGTREDVGNVLIKPDNGKDGISIKKTFIDAAGHLIIKLSDGTRQDAGLARHEAEQGKAGEHGAQGPIKNNSCLVIADYIVSPTDVIVVVSAIGAPLQVTLPAPSAGRILEFYSKYDSDDTVALVGTINGDAEGSALQPLESLFLRGVEDGTGNFEWVS